MSVMEELFGFCWVCFFTLYLPLLITDINWKEFWNYYGTKIITFSLMIWDTALMLDLVSKSLMFSFACADERIRVAVCVVNEHSSHIWEPRISHTCTLVVSHTHRAVTHLPVLSPLPQPILLPSFQTLGCLCGKRMAQVSEIEAGKKIFI